LGVQITVRSTDLDSFGHVNNARYLHYLEWKRLEVFEELGLGLEECRARGITPVVVSIAIRYRRELRYGDVVTVSAEPLSVRRQLGTLRQEVRRADGSLAAEAEVGFVFIDAAQRRTVPLPEEIRRWLEGPAR
jgi:thioesterase-3